MGHTLRHGGPVAQVLEGKIQGRRKQGRPRNSYMAQLYKDTNISTYTELKKAAQERERWKYIMVDV